MTFDQIWKIIGPHSQLGETRSRYLNGLLRTCPTDGELCEVGVFRGYTSKLIHLTRPLQRLHMFDTFAGIRGSNPSIDKHRDGDFSADVALVSSIFECQDNLEYHVGLFPNTLKQVNPSIMFSFCHIDCDTYFATKSALEVFWDRMSKGGILLFDDFKFDPCPGIEKALTEWSEKTGVEIMVAPSGGQAWIRKE